MGKTYVRVSGSWKNVNRVYYRVSGIWKECRQIFVRVSGSWKNVYNYYRFLYEGPVSSSVTADSSTRKSYENMAYVGMVWSESPNSQTYTGFTWDGNSDGDWQQGTQDNGDSENASVAMGLKNVISDYTETFAAVGLDNNTRRYVRLIGGTGEVTRYTSSFAAGQPFPRSHSWSLKKNDVIICISNCRTSGTVDSNFSCSGMTKTRVGEHKMFFVKQMTADGTFSTTITSSNHTQQWCYGIAVFRAPTV